MRVLDEREGNSETRLVDFEGRSTALISSTPPSSPEEMEEELTALTNSLKQISRGHYRRISERDLETLHTLERTLSEIEEFLEEMNSNLTDESHLPLKESARGAFDAIDEVTAAVRSFRTRMEDFTFK